MESVEVQDSEGLVPAASSADADKDAAAAAHQTRRPPEGPTTEGTAPVEANGEAGAGRSEVEPTAGQGAPSPLAPSDTVNGGLVVEISDEPAAAVRGATRQGLKGIHRCYSSPTHKMREAVAASEAQPKDTQPGDPCMSNRRLQRLLTFAGPSASTSPPLAPILTRVPTNPQMMGSQQSPTSLARVSRRVTLDGQANASFSTRNKDSVWHRKELGRNLDRRSTLASDDMAESPPAKPGSEVALSRLSTGVVGPSVRSGMMGLRGMMTNHAASFRLRPDDDTYFNLYPQISVDPQDAVAGEVSHSRSRWILHPMSFLYKVWWVITVIGAAVIAVTVPLKVAFFSDVWPGDSYRVFLSIFIVLEVIFVLDIFINFNLSFFDSAASHWVSNRWQIATRYLRARFWVDLLTVIPFEIFFDEVIQNVSTVSGGDGQLPGLFILREVLVLLRMLRIYRLFNVFTSTGYNTAISYFTTTLIRNYTFVLLWTHFAACVMYFLARCKGFGSESWNKATIVNGRCYFEDGTLATVDTWLGSPCQPLVGEELGERYMVSLYWAIVTMTTVGYGDLSPVTEPEICFTVMFIMMNIGLGAFVLGTFTLLAVSNDASMRAYRTKVQRLRRYVAAHKIPPDLQESMEAHIRLSFVNEQASDAHVLSIFPTTLRQKVLRYLYTDRLHQSYLYQGCSNKFLDILMETAKFELFMPQVEMVSANSLVTELMMLMEGDMQYTVYKMRTFANEAPATRDGKVHLGELFGEIAFFTETASCEAVSTLTVCRIMVLSQSAWRDILKSNASGAKVMLENLVQGSYAASDHSAARKHHTSVFSDERPPLSPCSSAPAPIDQKPEPLQDTPVALGGPQKDFDHLEVRSEGSPARGSDDAALSNSFNGDSTRGSRKGIRALARSGSNKSEGRLIRWQSNTSFPEVAASPRSGLDLSCSRLKLTQVSSSVLSLYDDGDLQETQKRLVKYVQRQHDCLTQQFMEHAITGNHTGLRTMLAQGADIDAMDYSGRTALSHVVEHGHLDLAHTLLMAGAQVNLESQQLGTPLLQACEHCTDDAMLELLIYYHGELGLGELDLAHRLCAAVMERNRSRLSRLLKCSKRGASSRAADSRTALHLAAAIDCTDSARLLIGRGCPASVQDQWGKTPADVARAAGHKELGQLLDSSSAGLMQPPKSPSK